LNDIGDDVDNDGGVGVGMRKAKPEGGESDVNDGQH
jgi:hypothetical protein